MCPGSVMAARPRNQGAGGDSISTPGLFRKADWRVRSVDMDVARRLVEAHHYTRGAANTATYLHGLFAVDAFWQGECVGVAWWIPPTKTAARALLLNAVSGPRCV